MGHTHSQIYGITQICGSRGSRGSQTRKSEEISRFLPRQSVTQPKKRAGHAGHKFCSWAWGLGFCDPCDPAQKCAVTTSTIQKAKRNKDFLPL